MAIERIFEILDLQPTIKDGSTAHTVDIKKVQYILSHEQHVPLPRQDNTDPQLVADLEAINYGRGGVLPPWMQD